MMLSAVALQRKGVAVAISPGSGGKGRDGVHAASEYAESNKSTGGRHIIPSGLAVGKRRRGDSLNSGARAVDGIAYRPVSSGRDAPSHPSCSLR